jgi:hypothetical protein
MNHPSSNGFYVNVVVGVIIFFGGLATLSDPYIVSPGLRAILFFSLVAISIVSHNLIIEHIKQREERSRQQIQEKTGEIYKGLPTSEQDRLKVLMNINTVTNTNINSPFANTNLGNGNANTIGNIIDNIIQQLPDSNNKSELLQLQEEIRQNHKLSPQEAQEKQIKVLVKLLKRPS